MDSEVVRRVPCAQCRKQTDLTAFAEETARDANQICATKNWAHIVDSNVALCARCYSAHMALQERDRENDTAHDVIVWREFRAAMKAKSADDIRENRDAYVKGLLSRVKDQSLFRDLGPRVLEIIAARNESGGGRRKGKSSYE